MLRRLKSTLIKATAIYFPFPPLLSLKSWLGFRESLLSFWLPLLVVVVVVAIILHVQQFKVIPSFQFPEEKGGQGGNQSKRD